ncbi:glycosyltransferase [Pelagicoccus sp. NFK12]|uniref:Glycosyltransferase n=1 Tax=Pelagicoccus enzymogenes TaxID=2773457 RepID=A0A927F7Q3_9BACT|nr:glycosyltransferase [Pelagicoccus enzymogenes]MBD5778700.1 glycosyltransferase [Pelagicoccus enzymogenes]
MNILFINYGDLRSNSMEHICPYANELSKSGHSCSIAVEKIETRDLEPSGEALYSLYNHLELAAGHSLFPNGKPADLIHAWTPRENVRKLTLEYQKRHPKTKLIVHLEDNEESILESYYLSNIEELRQKALEQRQADWHPRLSHPIEFRRLLAKADAVTLITPSLQKLLPICKETLVINPIIEAEDSPQQISDSELRQKYGLPDDTIITVFPGGITSNNREDIRNLYLAIHALQRDGIRIKLVKTGPSCDLFERSFRFDIKQVAIDLGYISERDLKGLIGLSNLLVQPGQDNAFNRDRFPCKIPVYLSSHRPCIIPSFYQPYHLPEDQICLSLTTSSPEEIAEKIKQLIDAPEIGAKLAKNAHTYALQAYAPRRNRERLERFYSQVISSSVITDTEPPKLPEELHAEIAELKREIAEQAAESSSALKQKEQELCAHKELYNKLQQELDQWVERDQRRRSTFSWQVTAPLRALRRATIDHLKKKPKPEQPTASTPEPPPALEPVALEPIQSEPIDAQSTPDSDAPPEGHRCYIKNYHKFVEREEWIRSIYLDKYQHPPQGPNCPKISILLPVYNVEEIWLRKCMDSVIAQCYQNWELCIADDASTELHIGPTLYQYSQSDPRIRVTTRSVNGHISAASNSAFELASGDYIALLDHDDELPPHALAKVVDAINQNPQAKLIYSDEDKIDQLGIRHDPHLKSDWNYDLLLSCNTISHLGVYRRDVYEQAGGFRVGFEGAQDWDLALRTIENCDDDEIVHIPEILYHWRTIESSTANHHSAKNYAHEAQRRSISDHLQRQRKTAELISIDGIHWRVRYPLPPEPPKVSIVIPTKDWPDLISQCVDSILENTTYPNYEVLVVDNQTKDPTALKYLKSVQKDPRVKVLRFDRSFNYSAINNYAVSQSDAEVICLLNNDTEVITPDWLEELVSHAIRPEIGVVGAKLLYPDDHIQHAGIVLGIDGVAKHAFRFLHKDDFGHVHRANLISQWSAVTGACLAFRRCLWTRLHGLDEENLSIAYNDVDFCLRCREAGFKTILTPYALLYHKESTTRGWDQTPAQLALHHTEAAYMYKRWPKEIQQDPYYNPNFAKTKNDFEYVT